MAIFKLFSNLTSNELSDKQKKIYDFVVSTMIIDTQKKVNEGKAILSLNFSWCKLMASCISEKTKVINSKLPSPTDLMRVLSVVNKDYCMTTTEKTRVYIVPLYTNGNVLLKFATVDSVEFEDATSVINSKAKAKANIEAKNELIATYEANGLTKEEAKKEVKAITENARLEKYVDDNLDKILEYLKNKGYEINSTTVSVA